MKYSIIYLVVLIILTIYLINIEKIVYKVNNNTVQIDNDDKKPHKLYNNNNFNINKYYLKGVKKLKNVVYYYVYESDIDKDFKYIVVNNIKKSNWNKYFNIEYTDNILLADIKIQLVLKSYLKNWDTNYSTTVQSFYNSPNIYINADNWLHGSAKSKLGLWDYRKYIINHEFGHALGYDHLICNEDNNINGYCPIMHQNTNGCGKYKCSINTQEIDYNKAPRIKNSYFKYYI